MRWREPVGEYLDALTRCRAAYVELRWPDHEREIARAAEPLAADLAASQAEWIGHLLRRVGTDLHGRDVPIYWLWNAPGVEANTLDLGPGQQACLIDLFDYSGSFAYEAVAHELLHVIDVRTKDRPGTLFQRVRGALQRDPGGFDDFAELAAHLVLGVEAQEAVRALKDPEHTDGPYLERLLRRPGSVDVQRWQAHVETTFAIRNAWRSHLAGLTDEAAALAALNRLRPSASR